MTSGRQQSRASAAAALPAFLFASALALGCQTTKPVPNSEGPAPQCEANPAWVRSPSPADSTGLVARDECSFHQWAYQSFLWLTSPAKEGGLVFEGLANPKNLFVPGPGAYPGQAARAKLTMLARLGKSQTTADIENIFQAGPGNKILVDQNLEVQSRLDDGESDKVQPWPNTVPPPAPPHTT